MADPFTFPDIESLNRKLREDGSATTSANVGAYERPLGAPVVAPRAPRVPRTPPADQSQFIDAEEYLRKQRR